MKKNGLLKQFLLLAVFLTGIILPPLPVNATLLIMPIHLILTERDRTGNITLFNTSGKESVFRIGWRYQKQLESGAYEVADTPFDTAHDLSKMAIFSPRQVTLLPGQKQRIRVSIRRPPDLADGEYRAHLALVRVGDENPGGEPEPEEGAESSQNAPVKKTPQAEAKIRVGLKMNVSYSLPVVLRQGVYNTTASIETASLLPPAPSAPQGRDSMARLNVVLSRTGDYSTFGKILVFWTAPGQPEKQIGITNNVNILPEITRRSVDVYLTESTVAAGTLRVVYEGEVKEKGVTLDEKTFPVGG